MKTCKCGCGAKIDSNRTWKNGHHARDPENKRRVREGQLRGVEQGTYQKSEQHKYKIGLAQRGEKANNWQGGRWLRRGYVYITTDVKHPRFGRKVPEHVLIAEEVLGRYLKYISQAHRDNEVVHHINGVKSDNRRENLLICTHSYHISLHRRMQNVGS